KTEFIQSFSDPHPVKCPACGGALKKLLSSPTAHFKGSGFHATDYGKTGGNRGESSSKVKEAGGDAKSEGGAEPKGDSAGENARDSRDSPKERKDSGQSAAKEAAHAKTSSAPSKKTSDRR
ncbi:MAG: FmdB family zinc ribbon protein, partial [Thermoanaerobaculia bacterium]